MQAISRDQIKSVLDELDLEWGVDDDADFLLNLLEDSFGIHMAYIWIFFYNANLEGVPLMMLHEGRQREVFREARAVRSEMAERMGL